MADATGPISWQERNVHLKRQATYTVTAGNTIYQGTYVALVAAGTASVGGDDASTIFAGIAAHDAAAGERVTVEYGHEILATGAASAMAAANIGTDMNLVDSQTVDDDAGTTNDVKMGVLVERVSDTTGWVRVMFAGQLG